MVKELDCRGLLCPMPIVKVSKAAKGLATEESLRVCADDPAFEADIRAWCQRMGFTLVDVAQDGGTVTATLRRG